MPFNQPIEKKYFSITEISDQLGLTASQLRYWEKEFAQLKPRTNARGKRFYNAADIEVIEQIRWLVKDQGYTIEGARKAMRKRKEVAAMMAVETTTPSLNRDELLQRLQDIRQQLLRIDSRFD